MADPRNGGPKSFGTGSELSGPPANIFFATVGRTEERFNTTCYYYY